MRKRSKKREKNGRGIEEIRSEGQVCNVVNRERERRRGWKRG